MECTRAVVLAASVVAASTSHAGPKPLPPPPVQVQGVKLDSICPACGVVSATRVETRKGEGSGVGAVGGAVLGGVLGHQVGGGSGKTAMTVLGAVGGGLAGNAAEKKVKETKVWSTTVTQKDGTTKTYDAAADPGLREGDVVKIEDGRPVRVAP
jgi:outer membrane lipoprotein SlyB